MPNKYLLNEQKNAGKHAEGSCGICYGSEPGESGDHTGLRVSPGMRPLAMKSCQSLGFPVCSMGSLLPASRTVRSQEMAGEWS